MENIVELFNNAIGWSIIHSLWQGASLYIILYGLFLIFYKLSSDIKYKIAYIFQCLVFASFIITCIKYMQDSPIHSDILANKGQNDLTLYLSYIQEKSWSITQMFPYIVGLYILGLLIQTYLCIKSFSWIKKIKQTSSAIIPAEWMNVLENIKTTHKAPSNVSMLTSSSIEGPITIGFLKPLILFPAAYINKISTEEAEAILLHEIAHIKRYDYFFNIVLVTIETILFFNPFVWLISRHIKLEREQSCDDYVTTYIKNPVLYARTLLHVELLRNELNPSHALALSGDNKHDLFNRIKRLNKQMMETKNTSYKQQLGVILCASMTFIFIAWMNPKIEKEADKENTRLITTTSESSETKVSNDTIKPLKINKPIVVKKTTIHNNDTSTVIIDNEAEIEEITKKLELNSELIEKQFNSPEWKKMVSKIEKNAKEIEKQLNSPEWKEKIAKIELKSKDLEAFFQSPEWKEKIEKIELNAKQVEDFVNSAEWKDKIAKIELNAKKLEAKFNSPEWKKKLQDIEELHNSEEYKAIQEKYRKEIQELKKQKGIE